jgi:protein-disulfide isomerase
MPKIRRKRQQQSNRTQYIVIGVVAVVVAAVLIFIAVTSLNQGSPSSPASASGSTMGQTSARVTIEEFADFQCPACGFFAQSLKAVEKTYIDTGKARVVFKHFVFIGPESVHAAEATECAGDQGKFWTFYYYLFSHQAGENQGAFADDKLLGFAKELGLDMNAFTACMTSGKYADKVQKDTQEGQQRGVNSTPTLFINGRMVTGALTADALAQAIDQAGQ